jgi:hypothetical protein
MTTQLIDLGWKWTTINLQNMGEAVGRNHAWWWRGGEGLLAIWEEDWETETSAVVMCIACELAQMGELLVDFRQLAGSMTHKWAAWFMPLQDDLFPILEGAGYKRDWEDSLYLFERQHS